MTNIIVTAAQRSKSKTAFLDDATASVALDVRSSGIMIDTSIPARVVIGTTGIEGLVQEIRTVLATRKGSVPLDRSFGLSWDSIDTPLPESMQLLVAEIGQQLERHVPRIRVKSITFRRASEEALDGELFPVVLVEIKEAYFDDFR